MCFFVLKIVKQICNKNYATHEKCYLNVNALQIKSFSSEHLFCARKDSVSEGVWQPCWIMREETSTLCNMVMNVVQYDEPCYGAGVAAFF